MERVSVYIDGANFNGGVRRINRRYSDFKFNFRKFCKKITSNRKLIDVKYYNASLKQQLDPGLHQNQQKYFTRLRKQGVEVILTKRQKSFNADGSAKYTIKGDDIKLAVDMVDDAHRKKFDTAILISGDGDFVPLVQKIKEIGRRIENVHFPGSVTWKLIQLCHKNTPMSKQILKKNFLQEITEMTMGDTETGKSLILNEKKSVVKE